MVIYCQTTGASAAHATHCATYCTPCRPLIRAFSGWIRTPPPTLLGNLILLLPDSFEVNLPFCCQFHSGKLLKRIWRRKKETTRMNLAAKTPLLHNRAILVMLHYVRRTEANMSTVVVISNGVQRGWRGPLSRSLSLLPSPSLSLSRPLSHTLALTHSPTPSQRGWRSVCGLYRASRSWMSKTGYHLLYLHMLKYTR